MSETVPTMSQQEPEIQQQQQQQQQQNLPSAGKGSGETDSESAAPLSGASSSAGATMSASVKPSGLKPPSRIGRPCLGHAPPKAGPPPPESKSDNNPQQGHAMMRRQSDEFSRSHLADVNEESEADLFSERMSRSSRSPDSIGWKSSRKVSNGSMGSDLFWEATGHRRSSDQGVVLTVDTDSFIIGQRVWVGGIRPGNIAFIGETHFAPGDWAGIVLDEPNGKNDGCVAGKRYFQCEPKRGIFSRLARLTREQLPGVAGSSDNVTSFDHSMRSMMSPMRSGTTSPTASVNSMSMARTIGKSGMTIGDRVIVSSGLGSRVGILKYMGETSFAPGNWCGVQLDEPTGKNDGSIDGHRYFECPDNYGIFVPLAKVTLSPSSKKTPRLSRASSRESLASNTTMGSIASTTTSRLRMSAQKASFASIKPLTATKNLYSLQDVLREKQNHVEQLIREREVNRQDNETAALIVQKDLLQLRDQNAALKFQLSNEKRKIEDLQASVDEASFCGEELNVQIQEYKDRITKLEGELAGREHTQGKSGEVSTDIKGHGDGAEKELEKLKSELEVKNQEIMVHAAQNKEFELSILDLREKLAESEKNLEIKVNGTNISDQCLREEIDYLTEQVEDLKLELCKKDEALEQQYLSLKSTEGALNDEIVVLQDQLQAYESQKKENQSGNDALIKEKLDIESSLKKHIESLDLQRNESQSVLQHKEQDIVALKNSLTESHANNEIAKKEIALLKESVQNNLETSKENQKILEERNGLLVTLQNELKAVHSKQETDLIQSAEKDSKINTYEKVIEEYKAKNTEISSAIVSTTKEIEREKVEALSSKQSEIDCLKEELSSLVQQTKELIATRSMFENDLLNKDKELEENEVLIKALQGELKELNNSTGSLAKEVELLRSVSTSSDESSKKLVETNADLLKKLSENSETLKEAQLKLEEKTNEITMLSKQVEDASRQIADLHEVSAKTETNFKNQMEKSLLEFETKQKEQAKVEETLSIELAKSKTSLDVLEKDLQEKASALTESTNLLSLAQKDVATKEEENDSLKREFENMRSQLNEKTLEIEKISQNKLEAMSKAEASHLQCSQLEELVQKLELSNGDIERKLASAVETIAQLSTVKSSLQGDLDKLRNTSVDSNSELARVVAELQAKSHTFDELSESSKTMKLTFENQLQEAQQSLTARNLQLERQKEEIKTLSAQKTDRENELNTQLAKLKELSETENKRLVKEIEDLKNSYKAEKESLVREIGDKLKILDDTKKQTGETISSLEQAIGKMKEESDTNAKSLEMEQTKFMEQIQSLKVIEENLKAELKAASSREQELINNNGAQSSELSLKLNELNETLATLVTERNNLKDELNVKNKEIESFNTQSKENTEQIKQLTDIRNNALSEKTELSAVVKTLEANISELHAKYQEMESEQVDLVDKNENLTSTLSAITDQLAQSDTAKVEIESKLLDALSNLKAQQDQMLSTTKSSEDSISSLQSNCAEKDNLIGSLRKHIEQLNSSANLSDDLKNELKARSEECVAKTQTISELQSSVFSFERKVVEKDAEIAQMSASHEVELKKIQEKLSQETNKIVELEIASQQSILDKEKDLNKSQKDRELLNMETEKLKNLIAQLESSVTSSKEKIMTLERTLKNTHDVNALLAESQGALAQQTADFTKLKETFNELENNKKQEINKLKQQLSQAENSLKSKQSEMDLSSLKSKNKREDELMQNNQKLERELQALRVSVYEKDLELKVSKDQLSSAKPSAATKTLEGDDDSAGQINFLNSIIADMQKKNETLIARVQTLETIPGENVINGIKLELPGKRKPAPRTYCDICEMFDLHDTDDCPTQSSSNSPTRALDPNRTLPPPRKYCEGCGVFGHEIDECTDEQEF